MIELFVLCSFVVTFGLLVIFFVVMRLFCKSASTRESIHSLHELADKWILFRPFRCVLPAKVVIPQRGFVDIGDCTVFLARLPTKLSQQRLYLEMLAYLDLYYYDKRRKQLHYQDNQRTSFVYTAISEEAYLEVQNVIQPPFNKVDFTFEHAINKYLSNIRWSSSALRSYDPKSNFIYFSTSVD